MCWCSSPAGGCYRVTIWIMRRQRPRQRRMRVRPMRDLFFIVFLALMMGISLKRPFLFVLVYAYIDIVSPQRLSYFLLNSIPPSLA